MDALLDPATMAAAVDSARPRSGRNQGGGTPYSSKVLVCMACLQDLYTLYNLSEGHCVQAVTLARNALAIALQSAACKARRLESLVKSAGSPAWPV